MDHAFLFLIAGAVAFIGSHFVLSHPLRAPLVRILGEQGFMGAYTVVSFATLGWTIWAFRAVGPGAMPLWDGTGTVPWGIASGLTLIGLTLLLGSLHGNPALPQMSDAKITAARASGVFAVTRHPMMWGIAIWAMAHVIVAPTPRVLVLMAAMIALALVGARLQDLKKAATLGTSWVDWSARTHYWPQIAALGGIRPTLWAVAVLVWLAATYGHIHAAHVYAGVWRWVM